MPKLKMSQFGVRKGLLIQEAAAKKMGVLVLPQIDLKKVECSGFFYVKGRENRRGYFCKRQVPSRIPLMISMSKVGAISLKAMKTI